MYWDTGKECRSRSVQMPQKAASDQSLHCLLKVQIFKGLKKKVPIQDHFFQHTLRDNQPTVLLTGLSIVISQFWHINYLLVCLP